MFGLLKRQGVGAAVEFSADGGRVTIRQGGRELSGERVASGFMTALQHRSS